MPYLKEDLPLVAAMLCAMNKNISHAKNIPFRDSKIA